MFGNHLRVALRSLRKYPGHTAINLFGLTVGLTVCLLVTAYVGHELSFESCHSKKDRIYRVQLDFDTESMGTMGLAGAAPPLGPALREASPDIEAIARFRRFMSVKAVAGTTARKNVSMLAVEPEFFSVFDVKALRGNPAVDLAVPNTVYLTKTLANSLFGEADPIGKTVTVEEEIELNVAGVIEDFPSNTKLKCDALASYSTSEALGKDVSDWMSVWVDYLFVLLRPGADIANVEALIPPLVQRHVDEENRPKQHYVTAALGDLYFNPRPANELAPQGDSDQLFLFGAVALVTLAIACVNFVNHTTARAANRVKELSVRKIVGAGRTELMRQLLTESLLVAALSAVAATAAFEITSPVLSVFLGRNLDVGLMKQPLMLAAVVGFTFLVGLTAGAYPALYLSRTRPLRFLKGGEGLAPRKSLTRRVLVVFQFATAIILTGVTAVVLGQIQYSQTLDKGFDERNVVVVEFDGREAAAIGPMKDALVGDPGVLGVSACDMLPGTQNARLSLFQPPDHSDAERVLVRGFSVDPDFASVLGLETAAGRHLSVEDENSNGRNVVIDERAVVALGLKDPVGTRLVTDDYDCVVVGVLKDIHAMPTFSGDWPIIMSIEKDSYRHLLVKVRPESAAATVDRIKRLWEQSMPAQPFEYSYYDQLLVRLYGDYEKFGGLLAIFSTIALVVAGLGVFSLASYAAERRRREIGIRKVVGATAASVVRLLGGEFVALVLVAGAIGCPVAWYLSGRWLERFVYRIDVGIGLFLLAGTISLIVALLSVSFQALKAASANPVDSLRCE